MDYYKLFIDNELVEAQSREVFESIDPGTDQANVKKSMQDVQSEVFCPAVCMIKYDGDEEAVAIANDSILCAGGCVEEHRKGRALMGLVGRLVVMLLGCFLLAPCAVDADFSQEVLASSLAHGVCNGVFVSGRTLEELQKQELAGTKGIPNFFDTVVKIDRDDRSVTVGRPFPTAIAVMRPGIGCVIAAGRPLSQLMQVQADGPALPAPDADALWPLGERVDTARIIEGVDRARLEKAIDVAFGQCPTGDDPFTRAIVVVHGGRIVAERYGKDFKVGQPLYAASMSKSVAATLIGLRIAEGRMALDDVALPAASGRPDPITNRHLITMTAGLEWTEGTEEGKRLEEADSVRMLLLEPDMAAFFVTKPVVSKPGEVFYYSSGATNLLMASLRKSFHGDDNAYWNYPRKALFDSIGMRSATIQTDAAGCFIGSTYVWASARDWARLGLLHLYNGRWDGHQLLPRSWVDFVRTPAPATAKLSGTKRLSYGAGFWLYGAESATVPAPVYAMVGLWGQKVIIDPARDLVVVRMGYTQKNCPTASIDPIVELFPAK